MDVDWVGHRWRLSFNACARVRAPRNGKTAWANDLPHVLGHATRNRGEGMELRRFASGSNGCGGRADYRSWSVGRPRRPNDQPRSSVSILDADRNRDLRAGPGA